MAKYSENEKCFLKRESDSIFSQTFLMKYFTCATLLSFVLKLD
jgi:hypothetical protein